MAGAREHGVEATLATATYRDEVASLLDVVRAVARDLRRRRAEELEVVLV